MRSGVKRCEAVRSGVKRLALDTRRWASARMSSSPEKSIFDPAQARRLVNLACNLLRSNGLHEEVRRAAANRVDRKAIQVPCDRTQSAGLRNILIETVSRKCNSSNGSTD